jgi:hypothetical protein
MHKLYIRWLGKIIGMWMYLEQNHELDAVLFLLSPHDLFQ